MNDVNDSTGSSGFKVLQKRSGMPTICIWRIYTLGGEVVQLFEVSIPISKIDGQTINPSTTSKIDLHYDFLLIGIFEGALICG